MHTRRYNNSLSCFDSLWVALESSDNEHVTVVTGDRLTQGLSSHPVLALGVGFELIEVPLLISECVRIAVCEVDNVRVILKCDGPGQRIVVPGILSSHRVLIVADVATTTNPALACAFGLSLRVDQWAHAMVVQTIWLHQIDDIEAVLLTGARIGNLEVVPLSVTAGVIIWLQD